MSIVSWWNGVFASWYGYQIAWLTVHTSCNTTTVWTLIMNTTMIKHSHVWIRQTQHNYSTIVTNGLLFAFAMASDCCCNTHPTKIILAGEFLVVHDNMVIIGNHLLVTRLQKTKLTPDICLGNHSMNVLHPQVERYAMSWWMLQILSRIE